MAWNLKRLGTAPQLTQTVIIYKNSKEHTQNKGNQEVPYLKLKQKSEQKVLENQKTKSTKADVI